MYKYIVAALLCLLPLIAAAQELKVESFTETMDVMSSRIQVRDLNGEICALVTVQLPVEGCVFEGGIVRQEFHVNQYYVYMPRGERFLSILCPGRQTLDIDMGDYLGHKLESKTIYNLVVSGYPEYVPVAGNKDADTHHYLVLKITPHNAEVRIDGEVRQIDSNGEGSVYLEDKTHTYSVSAAGYATQSGTVEMSGKKTLEVSLESTMADLVLTVSPANAQVTIDGEARQINGSGTFNLSKGTHTYTVSAVGYAPQTETVDLTEKLALDIRLESVMATLTLTCATDGVTFYVNGQQKGTGNWTGDMLADTYRVDARKAGHKSRSRTVTLTEKDKQTVAFPALEEITGRLNVDYKPIDSEVWIDGKRAGSSPDVFTVMVGSHSVEIRKDGYVAHKESVNVEENKEATVLQGTLEKGNAKINGHEYVDLGLSVKWATCNVGASQPEQYGDYYAWGETKTKAEYTEKNSKTYKKKIGDIKGTARDVAHVKWGGTWRMPTKDEFQELIDNCTWTWTTLNGANGYKVTSKKNGNSIFLPAAGYRNGTSLNGAGGYGYYWSSTPYGSSTQNACDLYFRTDNHVWDWGRRNIGRSVRPVSE